MSKRREQESEGAREASEQGESPRRGVLLVLEPDSLLRWSLVTYFSPTFSVRAVDSVEDAETVLETEGASALVVSDAVPAQGLTRLERCARSGNPDVAIIRVVTSLRSAPKDPHASATLEKPFELSTLAELLAATVDRGAH